MSKKDLVIELLNNNNVDAMIFYSHDNRYWFSRFASSLGYIVVTKEKSKLYLDGRYITAARKKAESNDLKNIDEILDLKQDFLMQLNNELKNLGFKKVGFESDWNYYNDFEKLKSGLKDLELVPVNTLKLREVKDQWEIEQIKKACDITKVVFEEVLDYAKPGITEKDLARFVSDSFLKNGADKLSFDTIVASGENGCMPHAVPTNKKLAIGELITLDMGCYFNGYCSDQTRTFSIGEVGKEELKKIYNIVLEAQQRGIDAVAPGVITGDIHKICFEYIDSQGYGKYFNHGTGHGIGTQIHEEPYNAINQKTVLQPGMCITVEPGIYIPGLGGVRIEDDILVTSDGYEFLTSAPRELIKIDN